MGGVSVQRESCRRHLLVFEQTLDQAGDGRGERDHLCHLRGKYLIFLRPKLIPFQLCLVVWAEALFRKMGAHLTDAALEQIKLERDGYKINHGLIKGLIESYGRLSFCIHQLLQLNSDTKTRSTRQKRAANDSMSTE